MRRAIISSIKFYQKIDIFNLPAFKALVIFDASCKYSPTCSDYMIGAIGEYGIMRGFLLGLKRIISCHPFSQGGFDPVPSKKV